MSFRRETFTGSYQLLKFLDQHAGPETVRKIMSRMDRVYKNAINGDKSFTPIYILEGTGTNAAQLRLYRRADGQAIGSMELEVIPLADGFNDRLACEDEQFCGTYPNWVSCWASLKQPAVKRFIEAANDDKARLFKAQLAFFENAEFHSALYQYRVRLEEQVLSVEILDERKLVIASVRLYR